MLDNISITIKINTMKYEIKITFKNDDIERYYSQHTDVSRLLPHYYLKDIRSIEIITK